MWRGWSHEAKQRYLLHGKFLIRWLDKPYLALGVGNVTDSGGGGACGAIFGRQEAGTGLCVVVLDGGK